MDCNNAKLKSASVVIGQAHAYKFTGECNRSFQKKESTDYAGVGGSSTTTNYSVSFAVDGSATWERASGKAEEKLNFSGGNGSKGTRYATASCSGDPFLKDAPGGAPKCGPVTVQVKMAAGEIHGELSGKQLWTSKRFTLTEVQAVAALGDPGTAPPPPAAAKPKTDPVSKRSTPAVVSGEVVTPVQGGGTVSASSPPQDVAGRTAIIKQMEGTAPAHSSERAASRPGGMQRTGDMVMPAIRPIQMEIEAEALVRSGAIQVAGGQARVQPMTGFGSGWSGGEQLFWSEGATGAVLDLVIDVPASSKYVVEIYMTRAPDYGKLQFEIEHQQSDMPFDGMAPEVMLSGPIPLGTFPLQAGKRRVSLMITGKYAQSTGYYVGIDKLRLYPAGPID